MKFSAIFLLIVFVYINIISASEDRPRLIGGHEAKPHSHPYLVSLQLRFLWTRLRLCSGSLLNRRWILTAGHCVKGSFLMNWLTMEAIVGSNNAEKLDPDAQRVKIIERIPHPKYDGGISIHDIAMVKTASDIEYNEFVYPIELPFAENNKYENLELAGWGVLKTTLFIPDLPDMLQEVEVQYVPFDVCYEAVEDLKEDGETNPLDENYHICTGPLTGGVAACSGDSGGPLIQHVPISNKEVSTTQVNIIHRSTVTDVQNDIKNKIQWKPYLKDAGSVDGIFDDGDKDEYVPVVVGVVSWGISPCGEVGAPTVYTKVSSYMNFINSHLYS